MARLSTIPIPSGTRLVFCLVLIAEWSFQVVSPVLTPIVGCAWSSHGRPFPLDLGTCSLPIDEITVAKTGNFSPWSLQPHCINRVDQPAEGPQFCIFTDRAFRSGRGISILTSPDLAASVADILDDSVVPPHLSEHPTSPLAGDRSSVPFKVQRMLGRGKGMIATRRILKWEVILVDFPAMITQNEYNDVSKPSEIRKLLEKGVEQLPEAQKERFLSLAHRGEGELIRDILRTNVFGGIDIGGTPHIALYPVGSRVNHNCKPNSFWRYDPKTLAQEVVALRDIEEGEEISHSYAPLGLTYVDRKRQLDGWGFQCTCSLCSAPQREKDVSDARRDRLLDIHMQLETLNMGKHKMEDLTDELTYLINKEEMWPLFCEYYVVVSRAHIAFGNVEKAKKYAQIADDTWHQYGGENHENVEGMRDLWNEIKDLERSLENRSKEKQKTTGKRR